MHQGTEKEAPAPASTEAPRKVAAVDRRQVTRRNTAFHHTKNLIAGLNVFLSDPEGSQLSEAMQAYKELARKRKVFLPDRPIVLIGDVALERNLKAAAEVAAKRKPQAQRKPRAEKVGDKLPPWIETFGREE